MKIRWIALALCLALLLPAVLTGCKSSNSDEDREKIIEESSKDACTLTLWVVTENPNGEVDAETQEKIYNEVNRITKSKYKTELVINYLKPDEYRAVMDAKIRDYMDVDTNVAKRTPTAQSQSSLANGMVRYPGLYDNQVDILLIQGEEMYLDYIRNGWLLNLTDAMGEEAGKKIQEYVNGKLIEAAKREGGIYAVPNNRTIGEYTFLLLDKGLMKETSTDALYEKGAIEGLFDPAIYNYLETVFYKRENVAGYEDLVPIGATYEECLDLLAYFWNINPDTLENEEGLSVLGYNYDNSAAISRDQTILKFHNLFIEDAFTDAFTKLNEYRILGYFDDSAADGMAALKIVTGDYADYCSYLADSSRYYPLIVKNPTVRAEDVCDSMFGICSKTVKDTRCMDIISCLNTDATLRNLLQYGIEGWNYKLNVEEVDDVLVSKVVYQEENPYYMNIFQTGNAFLAYPEPGMPDDIWENGKQQNLAVSGADPLLDVDIRSILEKSAPSEKAPTFSYRSGYSKEILSQNAVLAEWMKQADLTGPGSYLLRTSETSGSTVTNVCYFYDNRYAGTSSAAKDEESGAVTITLSGSGAGYHLGILRMTSGKGTEVRIDAVVNGASAALQTVTRKSLVKVDLMHTDTYDIRLTTGLWKISAAPNEIVNEWITSIENAEKMQLLQSVKDLANGKKKHTFLFCLSESKKPAYSVSVDPTGTDQNLVLNVQYQKDESSKGETPYALFLITVEADASVQVSFTMTQNGEDKTAQVEKFVPTSDPSYTGCGTADTELIRYIYELNQAVSARIAACTTVEELHTVISELKIFLRPHDDLSYYMVKYQDEKNREKWKVNDHSDEMTHLGAMVDEFGLTFDDPYATKLDRNYVLLRAVDSSGEQTHLMWSSGTTVEAETGANGEDYVLLDSPYKLYRKWLDTNKY